MKMKPKNIKITKWASSTQETKQEAALITIRNSCKLKNKPKCTHFKKHNYMTFATNIFLCKTWPKQKKKTKQIESRCSTTQLDQTSGNSKDLLPMDNKNSSSKHEMEYTRNQVSCNGTCIKTSKKCNDKLVYFEISNHLHNLGLYPTQKKSLT